MLAIVALPTEAAPAAANAAAASLIEMKIERGRENELLIECL